MERNLNHNVVGIMLLSLLALLVISYSLSSAKTSHSHSSEVVAQPVEAADMDGMKMATREFSAPIPRIPNQVIIENFTFQPALLTVSRGTKVTWLNRDDVPHTATDTDKRFNSKTLDTDEQFSFTFTAPGTYNYYCALHPKMVGQIIVQ